MCLRMAAMVVPVWQLALSLLLMVSSIYGMVWIASPEPRGDDVLPARLEN
jgi:hypothetical protein